VGEEDTALMTNTSPTAEHGGRPSRRLQATITVTVAWDAPPLDHQDSPVAMAQAYRQALQRSHLRGDPQVAWPGAPLLEPQDLPGAAAVARSVDVAAVPVNELHPDQVRMRLAPRGLRDWSHLELVGQFLNRRVYFRTWDGQRVEAEVAGFGALSDELYLARAAHAPGPGPTVSLWIPDLDAYCWANPESLTVCGTLPEDPPAVQLREGAG
jgi:hypothetical protein